MFGLGKRVDPIDQAKEWKRNMQREARKLDRDIASIFSIFRQLLTFLLVLDLDRQETKAIRECKKLAEQHHDRAVKILAREIVNR